MKERLIGAGVLALAGGLLLLWVSSVSLAEPFPEWTLPGLRYFVPVSCAASAYFLFVKAKYLMILSALLVAGGLVQAFGRYTRVEWQPINFAIGCLLVVSALILVWLGFVEKEPISDSVQ